MSEDQEVKPEIAFRTRDEIEINFNWALDHPELFSTTLIKWLRQASTAKLATISLRRAGFATFSATYEHIKYDPS